MQPGRRGMQPPESTVAAGTWLSDEASVQPAVKQPRRRDVARFKLPFYLLAVSCVVVYGTVLPFNNVASALLQERDYFKYGTVWTGPHNET